MATSYFGQQAIGSRRTLLEEGLERESRKLYPENPDIHRLVDAERLSRLVEGEIRAAGNDGKHFVTTREAEQIFSRVLSRELQSACATAQRRALSRMSLENPYSIARQAFSDALAGSEGRVSIDPNRLEADLRHALNSRFEDAIANRLPATALDDESALRGLADELMEGFVAERAAARAAVEALPIDSAARARMAVQVQHDDIPAEMVPAMGRAWLQVRDDLAELAGPLGPGKATEPLSRICSSMSSAFEDPGDQVPASDRDAVYRSAWRLLLAPGREAPMYALAGRMADPDSDLRMIGQGAMWFRSESRETGEGSRTAGGAAGRESSGPAASFDVAARYAETMENLAKVLRDGTGAWGEALGLSDDGLRLRPLVRQFDESIATLRSLGMTVPSPDSARLEPPGTPLSPRSFDMLREELAGHMASVERKLGNDPGNELVRDGIWTESTVDFDRGTYRVDGRKLARDPKAVANGLRALCTDERGRLNEEMLLGVSKVAYQAIPVGAVAGLSDPRNLDLSPFGGSPVFLPGAHRVEYNLSRNDEGEVAMNVSFWAPVESLSHFADDHSITSELLDPYRSELHLSLDLKLDATSFRPTLEDARVGYALIPGRGAPGR